MDSVNLVLKHQNLKYLSVQICDSKCQDFFKLQNPNVSKFKTDKWK